LARLGHAQRQRVGRLLGRLYLLFGRRARNVAAANIAHCFPELTPSERAALVRASLVSVAHLGPEVALCWRGSTDAWRDMIDSVSGASAPALLAVHAAARTTAEHECPARPVSAGAADNPGVLLLVPHFGNWELLLMFLGAEFGIAALYNPPKITALDPLIKQARIHTGGVVLPIGAPGLRALLQHLRSGGMIGLMPDQVPAVDAGIYVPFFGQPALTMTLAQRLVERHQLKVFLGSATRNLRGKFDICFTDLGDVLGQSSAALGCEAMNQAIAALIETAPEQYQWTYKRFKRQSTEARDIYGD
jgi:KDO2-lipid IV(A) lauroyltransferase